jgi:hypothetical protein
MHVYFDEAIKAEVQDAHHPVQMTGGGRKFKTLQQLSEGTGEFISDATHTNLEEMFLQVTGSLYFLLQVHEQMTQCRKSLSQHATAHEWLVQDAESMQASQSTAAESDLNAMSASVTMAQVALE